MARCTSTTLVAAVRGQKDEDGKPLMVAIRCQRDHERDPGPHFNGRENAGNDFTHQW